MLKDQLLEKSLSIDIADYWLIIRKRIVLIILIFALVNVAVVTYTLKQPPVYQATCKIKIASRRPMATIEGAQITLYGSKGNEINSELKLITNKTKILKTVHNLLNNKLPNDKKNGIDDIKYYTGKEIKELKKFDKSFSAEDRKYIENLSPEAIQGLITVEPVPASNIVDISARGPSPAFCIALSNIVAMVYRADFWHDTTLEALKTQNFIKNQRDKVIDELKFVKEEISKTADEKIQLGSAEVYQEALARAKIDLDRLKENYTDQHPKVLKQKRLIKSIEEQLAKFPKAKQTYDDSLAEREINQELRKKLGEHLIAAQIAYEAKKQKAQDEIQIIAMAIGAGKLKPNTKMNIVVGVMFGVILSLLCAFVWEGLDTSIGKIEDVERITQLPVIAHIPIIGQKANSSSFFRPLTLFFKFLRQLLGGIFPFLKKDNQLNFDKKIIFNFSSLSAEVEAYRTLRTNIHFALGISTKQEGGTVIAITSSNPREGKTLTSTNLAIGLAQMGKMTLLLECDMRCPQIAALFNFDQTPGLSDYLIGTVGFEQARRTVTDMLMGDSEWDKLTTTQGIDNLHIVPCGTSPPNPTELLISPEFKDLITDLRKKYDFVIIDTPPCLPVSDATIIGSLTDGTVLVYQSDQTSRHLLLRAIQTLRKNENTKLLGIVINQLSFDVIMRSTQASQYYGYYNTSSNQ